MATRKFWSLTPLVVNLKISRGLIILSGLVFLSLYSLAQTNISGVVNAYYQVVEVIPTKACVRLNTVSGLAQGDKTMVVQMKGATINTSDPNSSSFGDTISLNNAGNYETGDICYIRGDSVFFVYILLNQYTPATGKVQLVRIPQYISATVIDTLKAAPWNNATGTGGVLAIFVTDDLILNAPVSADSSGFRGGTFRVSGSSCNNSPGANAYAYAGAASPTQNGAYKGEGVTDVLTSQNGGRGATANGGGGGNNHNNGGAGGANLSAGGDGGGNSSSGTFNCRLSFQGKGGKTLSSYGGIKIFAGGGGGAGHANNGFVTSHGGGHGGGIIFIRANNLIGNNKKISANGKLGGPASSDGASGGGAGGTIIMNIVNTYTGALTIEANGGPGGIANDGGNINYCYGAGGGGSGGVIYFSGTTPAITATVTAGAAGPEIGRDASCAPIVPSAAGATGQIIQNYSYSSSGVLTNSYCSVLLPVELAWFNARYTNRQTILKWKADQPELIDHFSTERSVDGNNWETIYTLFAADGVLIYQGADMSPKPGYNLYRVRIIKKTNHVAYSGIQRIYVPGKNKDITIYPNPSSNKIFITGASSGSVLVLSDISGKLIWQKRTITNQSIIEVTLPSLPSGVYIIKMDGIAKRLIIP